MGTLIGYARCSTDRQDLTAQRQQLAQLGVTPDRIYLDHGLTGRNRDRPGLAQALAAVRDGDTLVCTKLDRLARSVPDARAILDQLAARKVRFALGGTTYDWADPLPPRQPAQGLPPRRLRAELDAKPPREARSHDDRAMRGLRADRAWLRP